jgi:hypothetical protein
VKAKQNTLINILERGLFLEKNEVIIEWKTKLNSLSKKEFITKVDQVDRTVFKIEDEEILDGLKCDLEIYNWKGNLNDEFIRVVSYLELDEKKKSIDYYLSHLKNTLGQPNRNDIEKVNNNSFLGSYSWDKGEIEINFKGYKYENYFKYLLEIKINESSMYGY